MRDELEERGHTLNRKRVQRLMRQMGLRARYPRRRTSQPGKKHKIYPYLLRNLSIERANQAWASDISYIPMAKGFMYLVAIMDWYSRRVLSWRVSNTLASLRQVIGLTGLGDRLHTGIGDRLHRNTHTSIAWGWITESQNSESTREEPA